MNARPFSRRRIPWELFVLLISLDVVVLLLEKTAVVGSLLDARTPFVMNLLKQPWWWLGLTLGPCQLWTWMRILAHTDLSVAYPLSSIGYPLTMMAAQVVFGEQLDGRVWLGALCITAGAVVIASTAASHRGPQPPPAY